ncbi:MAG: M18 family aminopeptidase [Bacteroidales bacterium]|nr:M18 family aminopeptidase [Candidatus Physcousia equi]
MINRLIDFLNESPVNFLAVAATAKRLEAAGYRRIDLLTNDASQLAQLQPGEKVYVTKNDSSIFAFHMGRKPLSEAGFRIICAHCDSPTFRIKPNAEMYCEGGLLRLNTEVYGGPILSTWFDRPLSLAGRVILRGEDAMHPITRLLFVRRPLLIIPNLAIHFNRAVNDGVKINRQSDVLPLMLLSDEEALNQKEPWLTRVIMDELNVEANHILDADLYLYDCQAPSLVGETLISAGRLDDLSMVHAALEALVAHEHEVPETTRIMAIFDNEETGSQTKQGAGSPFLANILRTMSGGGFVSAIEHSFMISADNAHAWHPNYSGKYDPTNHPVLGGGPVIKFNAAQKYASDAVSAAVFASICEEAGVPCQRFVNHSEVAGGSTLGNILASSLPLRGVDMGNGVLAMHSCRELASVADHNYCIRAFTHFYK